MIGKERLAEIEKGCERAVGRGARAVAIKDYALLLTAVDYWQAGRNGDAVDVLIAAVLGFSAGGRNVGPDGPIGRGLRVTTRWLQERDVVGHKGVLVTLEAAAIECAAVLEAY